MKRRSKGREFKSLLLRQTSFTRKERSRVIWRASTVCTTGFEISEHNPNMIEHLSSSATVLNVEVFALLQNVTLAKRLLG
jgi:hypothetical protein